MIVLTGSLKRRRAEAKTASATETKSRIVASRDRRDHHFAHDPSSPLTPAQRTRFDGPRYGPKQPDFAFVLASDRGAPTAGALVHLHTVVGRTKPFLSAG